VVLTDRVDVLSTVRRLREAVFAPYAPIVDTEKRYPYESMQAIREAGLLGLSIPREYGGLASAPDGAADTALTKQVYRERARGCSRTAQVFFVHCMVTWPLFRGEDTAQHRLVAQKVIEEGAAFVVASAEDGRTVLDTGTVLRPVEGGYLLNGVKIFCTGHGGAQCVTVSLIKLLGPNGTLHHDLPEGSCVVALDQPGAIRSDDWDNMGQHGTTSGTLEFRDVFLEPSQVWKSPKSVLHGPVLQCAFSSNFLGVAEAALDAGVDYVRTSTRPHPLARVDQAVDDPNIGWHFDDMVPQLHAARLVGEAASRTRSVRTTATCRVLMPPMRCPWRRSCLRTRPSTSRAESSR